VLLAALPLVRLEGPLHAWPPREGRPSGCRQPSRGRGRQPNGIRAGPRSLRPPGPGLQSARRAARERVPGSLHPSGRGHRSRSPRFGLSPRYRSNCPVAPVDSAPNAGFCRPEPAPCSPCSSPGPLLRSPSRPSQRPRSGELPRGAPRPR
jgi:hypothetical protein